MKCKCSITTLRGSWLKGLSVGHWPTTHHVSHYVGGTAAAAPPPFRPGEPALPNLWEPSPSHPILVYIYIHTYIHLIITYDTPHSGTMIYAVTLRNSSVSRYGKIACCVLCLYVWLLYFCVNCVIYVFLQYFDTVGWVFWLVKTVARITYSLVETLNHAQQQQLPTMSHWRRCVHARLNVDVFGGRFHLENIPWLLWQRRFVNAASHIGLYELRWCETAWKRPLRSTCHCGHSLHSVCSNCMFIWRRRCA